MSEFPLCSSRQIVHALGRAGFEPARPARGSHQTFVKRHSDGRKSIVVVVLGKSEVPRGTLRNILRRAGLTPEEFLELL